MKRWLKGISLACIGIAWSHAAMAQECCYDPGCGFKPFYIGVNGGFVSYRAETANLSGLFTYTGTPESTKTKAIAGLQIGYDWFFCSKLLGVVVDWDWTQAKTRIVYNPDLPSVNQRIEASMRWLSTLRARVGLSLQDVLFYLTGGAAAADFKREIINNFITPPVRTFHNHRWGWTIGFGSEFALCRNWTVNADVLYVRFHSQFAQLAEGIEQIFSFRFYDDVWVGRIGLNYRFSLCSL